MSLLTCLRNLVRQQGSDKTYWIAYSGGMDSHVLLALCYQVSLEQSLPFRVMHVNHGLSLHAAAWSQHCAMVCAQYQFSLEQVSLHLQSVEGESLEAVAREQRYAAFAQYLQAGDILLTAHHQDDQAETFLLQLMRGAGVKGLSAMPEIKLFAQGYHARPLLNCTRDDLLQYAKEQQLNWIEDESNSNEGFTRNYVRHTVMPRLQERWPSVNAAIARSAQHCAEAQSLLEEYGSQLCDSALGLEQGSLSVSALQKLSVSQQKLALRTWISAAGFGLPDVKKMEAILSNVLNADWDRFPCVAWGDVELRRHRDQLYVMNKLDAHDVARQIDWNITQPFVLPGVGEYRIEHYIGRKIPEDRELVSVRFRQGGEVIDIPGRGRLSLKNLLQEWNIVPWLRDKLPLIYVDDELLGIILHIYK